MKVRGLTLWRPWPWAIIVGSKRVENRPRRWNIEGDLLALHAGKRWDRAGAELVGAVHPGMPMTQTHHPTGCIVGAARVLRVVSSEDAAEQQIPWAGSAGWCYVLTSVVRFVPVIPDIIGRQGLFTLDEDTRQAVLSRWQLGAASRSGSA